MKDLSVKNKLYLGFGTVLAIILLLLAMAFNSFNRLTEANGWDKHTMQVLIELGLVRNSMLHAQVETRGYLLTGLESAIANERDNAAELSKHLDNVLKLTADNPRQQERLKKAQSLITAWINDNIRRQIEKRRALGETKGAADIIGQSNELRDSANIIKSATDLLDDAEDEENRLLKERTATSLAQQQLTNNLLIMGGIAAVAVGLLVTYLLSRAIVTPLNNLTVALGRLGAGEQSTRAQVLSRDELGKVTQDFNNMAQVLQETQLREQALTNELREKVDSLMETVTRAAEGDLTSKVNVSGEDAIGRLGTGLSRMFDNLRSLLNNVQKAGIQVTTSATEIAASAKQQEATGVEQAQTSVEVLSTTKEISANTTQLLKTMEDATAVADYTTSATSEAQVNLRRMDQTMQNMVSATDSINAKLAALSEKASNINSVLTTITKVADQTNILSLNAAIEAEKAGEAGRGFSVVATEIRRLADQTSVSTWDIEQMLKEMQSAVSASVMGMDKFSEEIRRSVSEVRQVTDQLSGVMDQVQKLAPQFDTVLQGMQSQAVGAQQITETMMQLNDATQQTVESLKATSEAVHQLQYAAGDLQSSVATFAVTV
ncbi:methyl-accepting chemotaxis protein [Pseudoduganella sp. RAF53_2]|uniref:methyl-accepting chemotaxis protein n=1 Tax=unclassified Pseudoduganella TaxID=2637179 RepID=UPI003F981A76